MMKTLPASLVLLVACASIGAFAQAPAASADRPMAGAQAPKKAGKKKAPAKAPREAAVQPAAGGTSTAEAPRIEEPRRSYGCE